MEKFLGIMTKEKRTRKKVQDNKLKQRKPQEKKTEFKSPITSKTRSPRIQCHTSNWQQNKVLDPIRKKVVGNINSNQDICSW